MASKAPTRAKAKSEPGAPIKLEIVDVEKVKGLSNYYAYIIKVLCKDGSSYHIYRRYSQFDHMQSALEKRFLIEAGAIKASDRILPTLPAKKYIGRSAIREVTEKRLPMLNTYLMNLFSLPDKIRYDSIVTAFTRPTADDLSHPYTGSEAYKTRSSSGVKPDRPPVPRQIKSVEKPARPPPATSISQGNAHRNTPFNPSERMPLKLPSRSSTTKSGVALYDYTAQHSDELSFQEGDMLSLLEAVDGGAWWKASCNGKTGLVPANYVETKKPVLQNFQDQVQESDEWDSSEDDLVEEGGGAGSILFYFNEAARSVEVPMDVVSKPTYISLYRAIQKQLHRHDIMLNYKDSDGDLVQITEQRDMALLASDATPPPNNKPRQAPWAIYITMANDTSVYNTALPR